MAILTITMPGVRVAGVDWVMSVLGTALDPRTPAYLENRSVMLEYLDTWIRAMESSIVSHRTPDGQLPARDWIELLIDRDTPMLELSPAVSHDASPSCDIDVITTVGIVSGSLVTIMSHKGGYGLREENFHQYIKWKKNRIAEISHIYKLPFIILNSIPTKDPLITISSPGSPPVVIVLDTETSRHLESVDTDTDTEPRSRLSSFTARNEQDAIRVARMIVRSLNRRTDLLTGVSRPTVKTPLLDVSDVLALAPYNPHSLFDPREILARILDGSRFDEFAAEYGSTLCAGWGMIHGYSVAILADGHGDPGTAESDKAGRLIRLAESDVVPLVILRRVSSVMDSNSPAHAIHTAWMTEMIANVHVPRLTIHLGSEAHDQQSPHFMFRWPGTRCDIPDDGIIDPRDTRTVLGFCLAVIAHSCSISPGTPRHRENPTIGFMDNNPQIRGQR